MKSALTALAVVLLLTGCTNPQAPTGDRAGRTTSSAPSAASGLPDFDSSCVDVAGDAETGADLTTVDLLSDSERLYVTFRLADPIGASDLPDSQFQVMAYDRDGNNGYIWGVQFVGGSAHVFQFSDGAQTNLDNGYVFDQGQVSIRFPVAEVSGLDGGLNWWASSSVGALDSDTCGAPDMIAVSF